MTTDTKVLLAPLTDEELHNLRHGKPRNVLVLQLLATIDALKAASLEAELRMPEANWLKEQIEYAYDAGLCGLSRHEVVAEILQHLSTPVTPTPK